MEEEELQGREGGDENMGSWGGQGRERRGTKERKRKYGREKEQREVE